MLLCHRRMIITGTVQGVGFRPFLFRLAQKLGIKGEVKNTSQGVLIKAVASQEILTLFQSSIELEKPPAAKIDSITFYDCPPQSFDSFTIAPSTIEADVRLPLLSDSALCNLCYEEMLNPQSRRYLYPFIHCIDCGPRFTLMNKLPFDRENTAMGPFSLCGDCQREYNDPHDRRFFSQTICCPCCGPKLTLKNTEGTALCQDLQAVRKAQKMLAEGKVLSIKNSGGFLLVADALSCGAAARVRFAKKRKDKPLAILAKDLAAVEKIAYLSKEEKILLTSTAAPIVLLRKKERYHLSPSIASGNGYVGIMLPSTGLLHLLLQGSCPYLIATSCNLSGMPLCVDDKQVVDQMGKNIDAILTHNRAIVHSLDDSVAHLIEGKVQLLRRAKGFVPGAITLSQATGPCLFSAGAQQKSTFALATGGLLYLSQHIGDLGSSEVFSHYKQSAATWQKLLRVQAELGVYDAHENYDSSRYAMKELPSSSPAQHHVCHILSCMLDNSIFSPVLGIAWDGTGLGADGMLWGGEAFRVSSEGATRIATFYPLALIGGEAAVKEPRRSAFAALWAAGLLQKDGSSFVSDSFSLEEKTIFLTCLEKGLSTPLCTSAGRLFDAVAALLGLCSRASFEGQGALALEGLALKASTIKGRYQYTLACQDTMDIFDWRPMIEEILYDLSRKIAKEIIAMQFHNTLADIVCTIAKKHKMQDVILSGGVMQNKVLSTLCIQGLQKAGFTPHWHGNVPAGDGGIAAGQALYPFFFTKRSS